MLGSTTSFSFNTLTIVFSSGVFVFFWERGSTKTAAFLTQGVLFRHMKWTPCFFVACMEATWSNPHQVWLQVLVVTILLLPGHNKFWADHSDLMCFLDEFDINCHEVHCSPVKVTPLQW